MNIFRVALAFSILLLGCDDATDARFPLIDESAPDSQRLEHPDESVIYDFANQCVVMGVGDETPNRWLSATADGYAFEADSPESAAKFFMKASDLGTYLFYDQDGGYLVSDDGPILRKTSLQSGIYLLSDTFVSGAEWNLEFSELVSMRYQLQSRRTGQYFAANGLTDARLAAAVTLQPAEGCLNHPEMSLDASGAVARTTYEDGDLFGFADTHSHIMSNFGFGGGGVFHGAPFHRLGVQHALGDCELFHGPEGRADLLGGGFSGEGLDESDIFSLLATGRASEPLHATDGWPTFSEWPSQSSATHNTQYYRWLERAWLSGLRLMVQHAVSNEAFCEIMGDTGFQPVRWDCNDMFNIDRQLVEIRRMERYIDAQSGGPGEGWFVSSRRPPRPVRSSLLASSRSCSESRSRLSLIVI